jgi:predicted metal-dependent RNase
MFLLYSPTCLLLPLLLLLGVGPRLVDAGKPLLLLGRRGRSRSRRRRRRRRRRWRRRRDRRGSFYSLVVSDVIGTVRREAKKRVRIKERAGNLLRR